MKLTNQYIYDSYNIKTINILFLYCNKIYKAGFIPSYNILYISRYNN